MNKSEACQQMAGVILETRDFVSSTHHDESLAIMREAINELDYHVRYSNQHADYDLMSIKRAKTALSYAHNLIVHHHEIIGDERPDLILPIDNLVATLKTAIERDDDDKARLVFSLVLVINADAEMVINRYYNRPHKQSLYETLLTMFRLSSWRQK